MNSSFAAAVTHKTSLFIHTRRYHDAFGMARMYFVYEFAVRCCHSASARLEQLIPSGRPRPTCAKPRDLDEPTETISMRNLPPVRYCRSCGGRLARDNTGDQCAPCRTRSGRTALHPPEVTAGFSHTDQMRDALASWHMGRVIRAYRLHPFHDRPLSQAGPRQSRCLRPMTG
jgi:hypothetical protein